jgi:multiple sugar transport system permease protein
MLNVSTARRIGGRLWPGTWNLETREQWLGFFIFLPVLIFFVIFFAYPLVFGIGLSFYKLNTITLHGPYVGLKNFTTLLSSSDFRNAVKNSVYWSVGGIVGETVIGMCVALLLNERFPGRNIARGLVLSPYLMPTVVAVAICRWMFNAQYGIINYTLLRMGFTAVPIAWLGSITWAMPTAIALSIWKSFPFIVIALLARLQTIPEALYSAAKVDGASAWDRFKDVTLPNLRGVLIVVVLLRFIFDFNDFTMISLLTGGGPLQKTETLPLLVYRQMFGRFNAGAAASVAVVMLVILAVVALIYLRVVGAGRQEEAA